MAKARKPKRKKSRSATQATDLLPAEPKPAFGRPPKLVADQRTIDGIRQMVMAGCSQKYVAAFLGVTANTFREFLRRNPEVNEIWEIGNDAGLAVLQLRQMRSALQGNVQMLKWLGINRLGQSNRVAVTGATGGTFEVKTLADFYGGAEAAATGV
jgi:hypothetical protein